MEVGRLAAYARRGTLALVLAAGAAVGLAPRAAPAAPVGINLGQVTDWDTTATFADIVKHARGWQRIGSSTTNDAPKDANGWPTTDASIGYDTTFHGGTYSISFIG